MKLIPFVVSAAACVSLLCSCAGVSVVPVGDLSTKDADARGIRFYQEAPFLFVYPDGKGGITSEVKWLPDTTQILSARPYSVLAKNDVTLQFTSSVLTNSTVTVDETDVVKASITALGKVLAVANTPGEDVTIPPPKLYRIVVDGDKSIGLADGDTLDVDGKPIVIKLTLSGG